MRLVRGQFGLQHLLIAVAVVAAWTALVTQFDSLLGRPLLVLGPIWMPIALGYAPPWVAKLVLFVATMSAIGTLAAVGLDSFMPYACAWLMIGAAMAVPASVAHDRDAIERLSDRLS